MNGWGQNTIKSNIEALMRCIRWPMWLLQAWRASLVHLTTVFEFEEHNINSIERHLANLAMEES
jgi:hypothetical protein